ncbi:MAG: Maf family protein, partial [Planctomycetes bacterium]|nr:Maf family protein [Planctomycetota bacterium]
ARKVVLGPRSPRRLEVLRRLVPAENIVVHPPADSHEPGFDDCRDWGSIEVRLLDVVRIKCEDVLRNIGQLVEEETKFVAVITADTVIVADDGGGGGRKIVLGKPPADETGTDVVRTWFRRYYAGRTHTAATALCVAVPDGAQNACITRTDVSFRADVDHRLEWYLRTGEPTGKAGGYALQGAGSLFVTEVRGSLSNVVGLPLETVLTLCEDLGIDIAGFSHDG